MRIRMILVVAGLLLVAPAGVYAADTTATSLMNQANQVMYYCGDGAQARYSLMFPGKNGQPIECRFWLVRRDIQDLGDQRYFIYVTYPDSLAGEAWLVHKKSGSKDNCWRYDPKKDRLWRITTGEGPLSLIGTDFTLEDVCGRQPNLDTHEVVGPDSTLRRPVTKIRSTPHDTTTSDYAYRISWIDDDTKLPLKEEYFDTTHQLIRYINVGRIAVVDDFPIASIRSMIDLRNPKPASLSVLELAHQTKLRPEDFNQELLKNPPAEFSK